MRECHLCFIATHDTRDPKGVLAELVDSGVRRGGDVPDMDAGVMATLTAIQRETWKR